MSELTDTVTELVRRIDAQERVIQRYGSVIAVLVQRFVPDHTTRLSQADFNRAKGMVVRVKELKSGIELSLA